MSFAREVLEIVTDTEDSERFDRMSDVLETADPVELVRVQDRLASIFREIRPPMPTFLHDEFNAALSAAFTYGVLVGREHARRGYAEPS